MPTSRTRRWIIAGAAVGVAPFSSAPPPCVPGRPLVFVHAAVLTMDSPVLVRGATVLVVDGKVAALNPSSIPPAACRIDAAGKVLLPGLSDVHVHT